MVATSVAVEVLRFQPETMRAGAHFAALKQAAPQAGIRVKETGAFHGGAEWLLVWGPGGEARQAAMARQVAAGGHAIALDLAYWDRNTKMRVSIDAPHPQAWVMRRDWPEQRFLGDRVPVAQAWNPKGPVIVAGIGRKARAQYAADVVSTWEVAMIKASRSRWPARRVLYRRKQTDAPAPQDVPLMGMGPIDHVLPGASLVITWHSNVAVDAIRMGIPVVCKDGAAAAVCPSDLPDEPSPLPLEVRNRFLANLAWFQWNTATESAQMWTWLQELLS